jgi:DNA-binding XRE family transcriptional regulator
VVSSSPASFRRIETGRPRGSWSSTSSRRHGNDCKRTPVSADSQRVGELEHLLESTNAGTAGDDGFRDLQVAAIGSQLEDLRDELSEYERLRAGGTTTIESPTLAGLADALIQARIARGWTQGDLADALGVAEQQVQRYEASRYSGASLARLCDIAAALDVTVTETVTLRAS